MQTRKRNKQVRQPQVSRRNVPRQRKANPVNLLSSTNWSNAPVARGRQLKIGDPHISNGSDRCTVRHSEYIADIAGSILFETDSFFINPGLATTFPWLSSIAIRYERYQFKKLRFHYEPKCSASTAGTVILAVDYDPLDEAPATKQEVLSYHGKGDSVPWLPCNTEMGSFIGANRGSLFTRPGTLAANRDQKTYDLGQLFVCTSGHAGTTVCGELYVDYEVELLIPQVQDSIIAGAFDSTAGLSQVALVGTNFAGNGNLDDLISVTGTSASILTFNQDWEGLVSINVVGTVMSGAAANAGTAAWSAFGTATYNAGATYGRIGGFVRALRGQTLVLSITATTVTGITWCFAAANLQ